MSATDLQTQGQHAYKRGEFEKALQYFDRALGRQQTVKLYDYRAATRDKLNDLPNALQDAKKAIRTGNGDPTGYIRAGDILIKMKKPTVALEIYAHGLKKVQHIGQGYDRLKRLHDDLQAQVAPQNSVDPMTRFPPEVACIVLEYLNFRQRIAICRVSKGWQKFIRSESSLWQHLDLSNARAKVRTGFISTAINTARSKLTAATLSRLYDYDRVLAALIKHCPIERLTLADTPLQGQPLVDALAKAKTLKELRVLGGTEISQQTLFKAMQSCQQTLEVVYCARIPRLSFSPRWIELDLPNLTSLDITASSSQEIAPGLLQFLSRCPLLRNLRLHSDESSIGALVLDLRERKSLVHVDLQFDAINSSRSLLLPGSVRTLRISSSVNRFTGFWQPDPSNLGAEELRLVDLPELEEIHLTVPNTDIEDVRQQLFTHHSSSTPGSGSDLALSKLRALSLIRPKIDTKTFNGLLTERTKDLEILAIRECRELDDERLLALVKDLPKLRHLDVSCSSVTGAGVKDILLLEHTCIKELVLNNCFSMGRDAVDWARSQGVNVQCTINEGVGGKKVRY